MTDKDHLLGRHDADIDTLKSEVAAIRQSTARIESALAEHKGGMRMLVAVGSIGGAVGASAVKLLAYVKGI